VRGLLAVAFFGESCLLARRRRLYENLRVRLRVFWKGIEFAARDRECSLRTNVPAQPFLGIVLFAERKFEPEELTPYKPLIEAGVIRRYYLEEVPEIANAPLGLSILYLIIIIYKLPHLSREEIQAMLQVDDIRKTRVFQEAKEEGSKEGIEQEKLRVLGKLAALNMSAEQIGEILELDVELVRREMTGRNGNSGSPRASS